TRSKGEEVLPCEPDISTKKWKQRIRAQMEEENLVRRVEMLETMMDRLHRKQEELSDLQKTALVKQDSMDSVVRALAEKFGIGKSHEEEEWEEHEETPIVSEK
ncbi:hypothetical protein KI387_010967, partial [Taxus chinensis]